MAHYASEPYRNANTLANHIMQMILRSEDERGAALLMREWRETEQMKREWRGIPRLSAHSMRELAEAKRNAMKQVSQSSATYEEIPTTNEGKESISIPTVPTPPAPEAPSAYGVGNDNPGLSSA